MMGPVGHEASMARGGPDRPDRPDGPGKKMNAVGQKARMAVMTAREAGADLPKNAQGMAASGLARGADPETLFASLIQPDPVDPVHPTDPVDPVEAPADDGTAMLDAKAMAIAVQDAPPELES